MDSMIERVARGIALADERNGGAPYDLRIRLHKYAKEQLFEEAVEAIRAMRDPTEAMIIAGVQGPLGDMEGRYQAMIDIALKQE